MHIQYRIKQLILLFGDAVIFFASIYIALYLRRGGVPASHELSQALYWFGWLVPVWLCTQYINGTYNLVTHTAVRKRYARLLQTYVANVVIGIVFFYFLPWTLFAPKTILVIVLTVAYILIFLWRHVADRIIASHALRVHLLFVGNTPEMQELAHIINTIPERGYRLIAWITDEEATLKKQYPDTTFYSSHTAIRPAVSVHEVHDIVFASSMRKNETVQRELYELLFWNVNIRSLTSLYETLTGRIPPYTFSETWFLDHLQHTSNPVYERMRRLMDVSIGLLMFMVFVVLYPFIAVFIKATSKGPILFTQQRVGASGTRFSLYKFRSMYALSADGSAETDGVQFAIKNDKRITSIGKFLRKTRLDELPQAINLLKGDLSIIGPRPERPEIVSLLEEQMPYYSVRHIVKPGITGWAQVNQHYTDTLEQSLQKLQYDLYYIKNRSMMLDLSILMKTVNVVLRGMGQ